MPEFLEFLLGLFDLNEGARGAGQNRGSTAADIADPFRGERGKYMPMLFDALAGSRTGPGQNQLLKLLNDPGSFTMDPGAQFAMEQGLEGVARHGNAMFGTTRSGNTAIELEKFATGFAGEQYSNRINQLLGLTQLENQDRQAYIDELLIGSGAKTGSPAAAADAYLGGWKTRDLNLAGGLKGLEDILGPLAGLFGQGIGAGSNLLASLFKGLGGIDFSNLNLTGDLDDFLASIGLGDGGDWGRGFPGISGFDDDMWERIRNIFTIPGDTTNVSLDLGDSLIRDSTRSLLEDLGSGIFGD